MRAISWKSGSPRRHATGCTPQPDWNSNLSRTLSKILRHGGTSADAHFVEEEFCVLSSSENPLSLSQYVKIPSQITPTFDNSTFDNSTSSHSTSANSTLDKPNSDNSTSHNSIWGNSTSDNDFSFSLNPLFLSRYLR